MSVQLVSNALLIVLVIGWMGVRQMSWRPVAVAQMWRFPAIAAVVGVVLLIQQVKPDSLTPLDLVIVAAELVISLAVGAWMGAIAHFRPLAEPIRVGRDNRYLATYESRTGVLGLVLWILVIAVRVGMDVLAGMAGAHLAAATGVILLVLAANRVARTAVFAARLDRHAAVAA